MASDPWEVLRRAVSNAHRRGWRPLPGRGGNTVSRKIELVTPAWLDPRFWDAPTYTRLEFLSFVPRQKGRVPAVVYGESRAPWLERRDRAISFKRSLELLDSEMEVD